jgi:hypothetical protein
MSAKGVKRASAASRTRNSRYDYGRRSEASPPDSRQEWSLRFSALALPVAGVAVADHHDPAIAANHLAVVADRLHARLDFHVASLPAAVVPLNGSTQLITCTGRRSAHASGRTG